MCSNIIEEKFKEAAHKYSISDVLTNEMKILFILESPHKEELKHNAPLAGSSGRSVSKVLFKGKGEETIPFGLLLKDHSQGMPFRKLGIMNVCPFPLQRTAIPDNEWNQEHLHFIETAEKVRISNDKDSYRHEEWNVFQAAMQHHFTERLQALTDQPLIIVPCGRFAQKHFRLTGARSPHWKVIEEVPHPSYNSWNKDRYKDQIQEVIQAVHSVETAL